jgi:glutamate-1-semialdehyde 2,1-aminomutase
MGCVAPLGPVYQAGTLSGNPLAMTAGLATLELLEKPGVYAQLSTTAQQLATGLQEIAAKTKVPLTAIAIGGMWGLFFHKGPVCNLDDVMQSDVERFKTFFHKVLGAGIYLAPSPYEAAFVSLAHTPEDIHATLLAFQSALR